MLDNRLLATKHIMNKECDAPQMDNSTRQPQFLDDKATTTTTTTKDPGNDGQQQQQQKIESIVPPPAERQGENVRSDLNNNRVLADTKRSAL